MIDSPLKIVDFKLFLTFEFMLVASFGAHNCKIGEVLNM